MGKGKKIALGCAGLVLFGSLAIWFSPIGDAVRDLAKSGVLDNKGIDAKFEGDSVARLQAMQTAALKFHESEDQFPAAAKWMDDIMPRLKTSDLASGEAEKKIVRPDLASETGHFGYAMNSALAGKYKGDISDPEAVLIYESIDKKKNAVGDPAKDGVKGGNAITWNGDIVKLP